MNHFRLLFAISLVWSASCCFFVAGFVPGKIPLPRQATLQLSAIEQSTRPETTETISSKEQEAAVVMLDQNANATDMGKITEPKHVPQEGENDFGGGEKFKRLLELAKQKGATGLPTPPLPAEASPTASTTSSAAAATAASSPTDMEKIAQMLEKRFEKGPGSIDSTEIGKLMAISNRVIDETEQIRLNLQLKNVDSPDDSADQPAAAAVEMPPVSTDIPKETVPKEEKPVETVPEPEQSAVPAVEAVEEPKKEPSKVDIPSLEGIPPEEYQFALLSAVSDVDANTVSALLNAGVEMDEATVDAAFWAVVRAVDLAEQQDKPLSGDIPRMLHHIFDADHRLLLGREKIRTNVTCMQPAEAGLTTAGMNYIFDDSAAKDLPLTEGRRCEDGHCCDECSRNIFPTFALENESNLASFPGFEALTFNDLQYVTAGTIIHFTRLIERVRRTIAHEYGLPLKSVLPLQAYSRKYVAGTTQQGGGGGEGDFVTLHTDEATHSGYHYSCVLYLSTAGEDFTGGNFVFNDPVDDAEKKGPIEDIPGMSLAEQIRRHGRKFTPYSPERGAAVIFSSGWENMHEVEKVTSGIRYAVPCFFTTSPVPEAAYQQMNVGKPKTDEDIADDWLHLLLAHRAESPQESLGRVKELLMKWHFMCTPLSEH